MERLSARDASLIYTETTRTTFEIGTLMVLDTRGRAGGEAQVRRLRDQIASRLDRAPRMRHRVQRVPFDLQEPVWVDDDRFEIDYHVRHSRLPGRGDRAELVRLVNRLLSTPLDHSRPLWELYLVEGLEDGRSAIFIKTHHAAFDGRSALQVLTTLVDEEPDPAPSPMPGRWSPRGRPRPAGLLARAALDVVRHPLTVPREVARLGVDLAGAMLSTRPAAEVLGTSMSPPSPFNRRLSGRRSAQFFEIDLAEVLRVKEAEDVKLNDVVLCLVGGGVRRHLERRGEATAPSLVTYLPITLPGEKEAAGKEGAGDRTSVVSARIGTDEPDPVARLRSIAEQTRAAKARAGAKHQPLIQDVAAVAGPGLGPLVERLAVGARVTEVLRLAGNLVVSNVASIPAPAYALGALIEEVYPIGPLAEGVGLSFTLLSYRGRVCITMLTEPEIVTDPELLVDDCLAAFDELAAAVG